jgi:CRISPR/Cas system CSM-associated protein Csm4 (group 5 of RAMP superfamily)
MQVLQANTGLKNTCLQYRLANTRLQFKLSSAIFFQISNYLLRPYNDISCFFVQEQNKKKNKTTKIAYVPIDKSDESLTIVLN